MPLLEILYEDNHLLFLNKPAGLLTQPSGTEAPSLEMMAKAFIKKRDDKPGNVYLHAVHRLDKPASGIVLFAKSAKALSRLNTAMRERCIEKRYLALVRGTTPEPFGTFIDYIEHGDHYSHIVTATTPQSQKCHLSYILQATFPEHSLLAIDLGTGRYHQIRAQLAAHQLPIVGDTRYGSAESYTPNAIALHHLRMTLTHPVLATRLEISTPLPPFAV